MQALEGLLHRVSRGWVKREAERCRQTPPGRHMQNGVACMTSLVNQLLQFGRGAACETREICEVEICEI